MFGADNPSRTAASAPPCTLSPHASPPLVALRICGNCCSCSGSLDLGLVFHVAVLWRICKELSTPRFLSAEKFAAFFFSSAEKTLTESAAYFNSVPTRPTLL